MRIGLIDVDLESRGKCTFPNICLMKLSAWHKKQGDSVEWYQPLISGHMDIVYMSKVFSNAYTNDYPYYVDADRVIKGGSGYAITLVNGKEVYDKHKDIELPCHIEHIMPDYSIYEQYGIHDTAYGFITRGCPRGCNFCHVAKMQGRKSVTVSSLDEFWNGQKNIKLLDPNIGACKDWREHFKALIDSKALVDFTQGVDIRLMNHEKWEMLSMIKTKTVHFAWDNPKDDMIQRLEEAVSVIGVQGKVDRHKYSFYILTNFDSTFEQDVYRVETVKKYGFQPYVMIYNKPSASKEIRHLARYANNPVICWKTNSFEEYEPYKKWKDERNVYQF